MSFGGGTPMKAGSDMVPANQKIDPRAQRGVKPGTPYVNQRRTKIALLVALVAVLGAGWFLAQQATKPATQPRTMIQAVVGHATDHECSDAATYFTPRTQAAGTAWCRGLGRTSPVLSSTVARVHGEAATVTATVGSGMAEAGGPRRFRSTLARPGGEWAITSVRTL